MIPLEKEWTVWCRNAAAFDVSCQLYRMRITSTRKRCMVDDPL